MKTLTAQASEQELLGYFRIFATPPGGFAREITLFRDAPVMIGAVATQDPFTEATASLSFPQITVFDTPGEGDLDWLVVNTDIDIVWENVGGYNFDWRWEGYIASYSFSLSGSDSSFNMDLKGAFFALDDYLAIPAYPKRPIPYEILIARAFDQTEHPAHLGKFRVLFPSDWKLKVPAFTDPAYLIALKPWGIATDMLWTGFTSRSTGTWDPMLSSYVQGLLSIMFAEGGSQWSIRNRGQRRPELFLRRVPDTEDDKIIEIVLGAPGVSLNGTRDYTQRAGVIYGEGKDDSGTSYSNIQVTPDGRTTYYHPFAYSNRMWPRKNNPNYDPNIRPIERRIKFESGIDELTATTVAQGQYQRFAEPGITGDITLTSDVRMSNGQLMPRLMIRAGASIRIKGLFGVREGVLAHVTQVTADFTAMTTSLTFDTKYRDQLTVEEVRARNKDALQPLHALKVGVASNTISDLVLPWSYKNGSGIIPTPAKEFFNQKLPVTATFPFEEFTRQYPPNNPSYKSWYVKIPPMDPGNSNNNWSAEPRDGIPTHAIPIRMGQQGTIRLSQLAAYDGNGNVMRVKFHLSVYKGNGFAVDHMPQFPSTRDDPIFPDYLAARQKGLVDAGGIPIPDNNRPIIPTSYQTGDLGGEFVAQTNPFYKGAWESIQPDGTLWPWDTTASSPNDIIVGWGNYYEPAGYWPGRFSNGANRTGMLSDDNAWTFSDEDLDLGDPTQNQYQEYAGMLFVMIYCDDQLNEPVYFMGRFIRTDPVGGGA